MADGEPYFGADGKCKTHTEREGGRDYTYIQRWMDEWEREETERHYIYIQI